MLDKIKNLDRDNLHFVLLACVLVFGLLNVPVGHLKPAGAGILYWWPTHYTFVWIGLSVLLIVLLLIGRSQILAAKIKGFVLLMAGAMILTTLLALWTCTLCRTAVYADRVERQTLTAKGLQRVVYSLDKVQRVKYACRIVNNRGLLTTSTSYILELPFNESVDLSEARNDGRDEGMWVKAIAAVDGELMQRNVRKNDVHARDGQVYDNSECLEKLATERTPEETAVVLKAFQPNDIYIPKKRVPRPA